MSNALVLTLQHAPPSTNHLYANVAGKGRVKAKRYKEWKNTVGWDLNQQNYTLIRGPVELDLTVRRPKKGVRADISNRIKAVEDLLVDHQVLKDDSQVMEVRARWGDVEGTRIEIMPVEAN